MNPNLSGQEIFDAGIAEGTRRLRDSDYPKTHFTLAQVEEHDKHLLDAVVGILRNTLQAAAFIDYPVYTLNVAIKQINGLRDGMAPKQVLRWKVTHMLPVCSTEPRSEGVPVVVWSTAMPALPLAMDAFYGMRLAVSPEQPPCFYHAGGLIPGVTNWRYRDETPNT
jgi:hypothetical protein